MKELEACGNDIDFAIINLEALCCKSMKENVDSAGMKMLYNFFCHLVSLIKVCQACVEYFFILEAMSYSARFKSKRIK